jgi:LysM repeat protein
MQKRTSAFARLVAVLALAGAVVVVIVAISSSLGGDSDSSKKGHGANRHSKQHGHRTKASSYVVETGDTLTSIAHETGVPVAQILKLNPEVDPQILIAGEKLKLR